MARNVGRKLVTSRDVADAANVSQALVSRAFTGKGRMATCRRIAARRPWFQSYALFPHMTVAQNVAFGLENPQLFNDEVSAFIAEP